MKGNENVRLLLELLRLRGLEVSEADIEVAELIINFAESDGRKEAFNLMREMKFPH